MLVLGNTRTHSDYHSRLFSKVNRANTRDYQVTFSGDASLSTYKRLRILVSNIMNVVNEYVIHELLFSGDLFSQRFMHRCNADIRECFSWYR